MGLKMKLGLLEKKMERKLKLCSCMSSVKSVYTKPTALSLQPTVYRGGVWLYVAKYTFVST